MTLCHIWCDWAVNFLMVAFEWSLQSDAIDASVMELIETSFLAGTRRPGHRAALTTTDGYSLFIKLQLHM